MSQNTGRSLYACISSYSPRFKPPEEKRVGVINYMGGSRMARLAPGEMHIALV